MAFKTENRVGLAAVAFPNPPPDRPDISQRFARPSEKALQDTLTQTPLSGHEAYEA
ncbi:hypothetical protein [Neisseria iguanae]|uniref:hypothetical protein n=1 Tax=Neisseria iguanae TaxID=90242 RepID=UPI001474DC45|nr:hypothetical protein [Neisseria iguanae]